MKTIEASVEQIIYEATDNAYKVLRIVNEENDKMLTAVGELPALTPGQQLSLQGEFTQHQKFGRQFQINQAELHEPTTIKGIQNYLASSLIRGVGPKIAEKITDRFGTETLQILNREPERLEEVDGIGASKLAQIEADWNEQRHMQEVMLFLKEHGVSTAYAQKIYEHFGNSALDVLKENPYRLSREITGIGFKIADRIARKLEQFRDRSARLEAGLEYALREAAQEGHVYLEADELKQQAGELLKADVDSIETPLAQLEKRDRIVRERNGTEAIYLKHLYRAEQRVGRNLQQLREAKDRGRMAPQPTELRHLAEKLQHRQEIEYNEKQVKAIRTALEERLVVLTGGPGTGKTTTVIGMLAGMKELDWEVKLAAPTGRAAQRLEETTEHEASTIHRLLEYSPPATYEKNENDQLETDAVIIDELSMVDLRLMDRLLRAVETGTRLILVGDADQLPAVGPGNVLNDLIESDELPVVRLTEIFRQAKRSRIVQNAHRINQGKMPGLENEEAGDLFFLEESDPEPTRETVLSLVSERLPEYYQFDPFEEIQVVAPMYRGECGVDRLNETLQSQLNPGRDEVSFGKQNFREGDRVMQLENNYDKYVFNGDVGRINEIDRTEEKMRVSFPGDKSITYDEGQLNQLSLAYAITIHKSQGSEFPAVIIPLLTQHYIMLQRNLLYTALTRARDLAVLVGTKKALGIAVNNARDRERNSRLPKRIG